MTRLAYALIGGFLGAVLVFVSGFFIGHKLDHQAWDNSNLVAQVATDAKVAKLTSYGTTLAGQLTEAKAKNKDLLAQQQKEVPDATSTYKPTESAAPVALPAYRFTRYAVCLWNGPGLQTDESGGASGTSGSTACASAPDAFLLSDVTPADALDNALVNAASCRDDRATLVKDQLFLQALANGQVPTTTGDSR